MVTLLQSTVHQCVQCVFCESVCMCVCRGELKEYMSSKTGRLLWLVISQMRRTPVLVGMTD